MQKRLNALIRLRKYLFTGIATIFPIGITVYLLLVVFRIADNLLGRAINAYMVKQYGYKIPGLGIVIGLLVIVFIGMLADHIIGRRLIPFLERYILRLPLIRHIYSPARQLSDFFFKERKEGEGFRRVVLAQYPSEGSYSIGFLTNENIDAFNAKLGTEVVSVLISTPPSPFSGPLVFLPKDKVKVLDISIEDTIKFVVSGGLAAPQTRQDQRPQTAGPGKEGRP